MNAVIEISAAGPQLVEQPRDDAWVRCGGIPFVLEVLVEVSGMTLREVKGLLVGSMVRTQVRRGNALPLNANQAQIGWCELQESGGKLGARISEWK